MRLFNPTYRTRAWFKLIRHTNPFKCETQFCNKIGFFKPTPGMTQYPFDGEPESKDDPNRFRIFCPECSAEFTAGWEAMWKEYNESRG